MRTLILTFAVSVSVAGCATAGTSVSARTEIEAAIARGVEATRNQDIEAYMSLIPEDLVLRDNAGNVLSREQLRENALRDWSIIPETIAISASIDSISFESTDSATVFTSQRWERLMLLNP